MMRSPSDDRRHSDERLVDYLLGALPDEEAERLDELSVTDDEVAWRLQAIENDLVDAYVRGELPGAALERFETAYLASPGRRRKVEFAEALRGIEARRAARSAAAVPLPAPRAKEDAAASARGTPRQVHSWALAAAALVAVSVSAYFFMENRRLQEEVTRVQSSTAGLEGTAAELRTELEQERSVNTAIRDELARLRASLPAVRVPPLRPFVLLPMRRGVEGPSLIEIPAGSGSVPMRLRLESEDFASYVVVLRNPATGEAVWESGRLRSRSGDAERYVEIEVPAAVLEPRTWTLELTGRPVSGPAEFVTSYVFRVEGR